MIPPFEQLADHLFLHRLAAVDFGPIAFRLTQADPDCCSLTLEQATQAIEQYRRFLFLHHRYPNRLLVPSRKIDQVWHTHILDTAKYREDCSVLFGRFIDHYPYFGLGSAADQQTLAAAYADTQALFHHYFRDEPLK